MTSIALTSMAKRAAEYTVIERRNQLSKLCWYAAGEPAEIFRSSKEQGYFVA